MTATSGPQTSRGGLAGKLGESALGWAAVTAAAAAAFAWAACCVLPMALAVAGLGLGGLGLGGLGLGGLGWIAGQRAGMTLAALVLVGVGWALVWRRARMCRIDSACAAPSPFGTGLLAIATALCLLALAWQPIVEPWALALIRSARG